MERTYYSTRVFSLVLLLLLIAMSTEIGMTKVGEARTCESKSKRFKGLCVSRTNCANVCKTEGFPAGHCRGLRRRCFCLTHCT